MSTVASLDQCHEGGRRLEDRRSTNERIGLGTCTKMPIFLGSLSCHCSYSLSAFLNTHLTSFFSSSSYSSHLCFRKVLTVCLCLGLNLLEPVPCGGQLVDSVHYLSTSDERNNNGGSDNGSKHKTVAAVPWWCPAAVGGNAVNCVESVEGKELCNQSILNREHDRSPSNGGSEDTNGVALVALGTSVASPLETPMDRSEEREDLHMLDGTIVNAGLENIQQHRIQPEEAQGCGDRAQQCDR
jgi:hypothetical protein